MISLNELQNTKVQQSLTTLTHGLIFRRSMWQ